MSKKQRKFIRDFKDYQSGRILTFHRKYDYMYVENDKELAVEKNRGELTSEGGQTKEKKYFPKEAGVGEQEAEEEEPGSQDTSKEKKSSDKQGLQQELAKGHEDGGQFVFKNIN
ncbi:hypothetical protein NDU88_002202 [Pleurodeles waltl]|uniref:Uncharacterized protein n=1 Tax=Pleurodeles waltl TaxID=8319 RepID=A0AAV7TJV7_PLEWA|nr:hypothetical protein NDU88_002202 [Pleurodeles waltl]